VSQSTKLTDTVTMPTKWHRCVGILGSAQYTDFERSDDRKQVGTATKTTLGEADLVWDVDLLADSTSDALLIVGYSNVNGDTIRFVATMRKVEMSY
jgi:hypothetical protein